MSEVTCTCCYIRTGGLVGLALRASQQLDARMLLGGGGLGDLLAGLGHPPRDVRVALFVRVRPRADRASACRALVLLRLAASPEELPFDLVPVGVLAPVGPLALVHTLPPPVVPVRVVLGALAALAHSLQVLLLGLVLLVLRPQPSRLLCRNPVQPRLFEGELAFLLLAPPHQLLALGVVLGVKLLGPSVQVVYHLVELVGLLLLLRHEIAHTVLASFSVPLPVHLESLERVIQLLVRDLPRFALGREEKDLSPQGFASLVQLRHLPMRLLAEEGFDGGVFRHVEGCHPAVVLQRDVGTAFNERVHDPQAPPLGGDV
mmetsp:Transcript_56144/g.134017  ORF Transcript_56144/g.134017 Transcript_56144/m.134017 type:complete len:317 (-) Transcript_56144:177-1127(-)